MIKSDTINRYNQVQRQNYILLHTVIYCYILLHKRDIVISWSVGIYFLFCFISLETFTALVAIHYTVMGLSLYRVQSEILPTSWLMAVAWSDVLCFSRKPVTRRWFPVTRCAGRCRISWAATTIVTIMVETTRIASAAGITWNATECRCELDIIVTSASRRSSISAQRGLATRRRRRPHGWQRYWTVFTSV